MSSTDPSKNEIVDNVGNNLPRTTTTASTTASTSTSTSAWKLEDSSIWWLSYFWEPGNILGWQNNPGNILLLTSVPFFAGAYFGYRMPTDRLEDLIQGSTGGSSRTGSDNNNSDKRARNTATSGKRKGMAVKPADQGAIKAVAAQTASKALRIATLGTVGTFGFIGAIGFYVSGYNSLEEAVVETTGWASSWGKSLEHLMGGDEALSKTHPEVLATKHMKGEEEWSYIYDKYIKDEIDEEDKDKMWQDVNDPKEEEDAAPTLYSIYEKYFPKKDDD